MSTGGTFSREAGQLSSRYLSSCPVFEISVLQESLNPQYHLFWVEFSSADVPNPLLSLFSFEPSFCFELLKVGRRCTRNISDMGGAYLLSSVKRGSMFLTMKPRYDGTGPASCRLSTSWRHDDIDVVCLEERFAWTNNNGVFSKRLSYDYMIGVQLETALHYFRSVWCWRPWHGECYFT